MTSKFPPTPEQQSAVDAFRAGGTVVLVAGAGAGKTSTLQLIAEEAQRQGRKVLYIAYNKAIATEAKARFPRNTTCSTAHALAFGAGGRYWGHRLSYPRQNARKAAEALNITAPVVLGDDVPPLAPQQAARLALSTVKAFCGTADQAITTEHVPNQPGYDTEAAHEALAKAIVPFAERAWADIALKDGNLKYQHDYYFKRWQLSGPRLEYDVILLDECQDTDPVLADVFKRQAHPKVDDETGKVVSTAKQLVLVGDRNQAIYGWRGCVDIMGDFPGATTVPLTKSFRFGPAIAGEANRWLSLLDSDLRMVGHDPIASVVGPVAAPDAIICRSNAGVVTELLRAHEAGLAVAMVGGGQDIKSLAEAALHLKRDGYTSHPELSMFVSWQQVCDYVERGDLGSEDLKVAVELIKEHGSEIVIDAIERLVDERDADVTITTAHKSKGREWDRVRAADDFREPKEGDELDPAELMLAYVTVTRARLALDRGSLDWIDGHGSAPLVQDPVAPVPTIVQPISDVDEDDDEVPPSAVELAQARVDAAADPLSRAVALLRLWEVHAREAPRDDADRAAMVRAIVAAHAGRESGGERLARAV